jgi:hypothetical protein
LEKRIVFEYENESDREELRKWELNQAFIKPEMASYINTVLYFPFTMRFKDEQKQFFTDEQSEHEKWIEAIKKVLGYTNFHEFYKFGVS